MSGAEYVEQRFIHSLTNSLPRDYRMPGTVLGRGTGAVDTTGKTFALMELIF